MVQCTLEGGTKSPVFKADNHQLQYQGTVNFNNQAQDIRKVYGKILIVKNEKACLSVYFRDQNNSELFRYDLNSSGANYDEIREIAQNERLIGVYGVKNDKFFSSLGFIVLEIPDE